MQCDECPQCVTDLEKKIDELERQVKEAYEAGQLMCECPQTSEAVVLFNDLLSDNKVLRELLWLNHGCSLNKLYGDDGERQCNNGGHMIDFKRDSAEVIKQKLGGI